MKNWLAFVVIIAFSVLGVVGDYLLKLASGRKNPFSSKWFYLGFAVYASTAFGWVFVMRHLKLATIGVVYSVSMILVAHGHRRGCFPRAALGLRDRRTGDGDRFALPADSFG